MLTTTLAVGPVDGGSDQVRREREMLDECVAAVDRLRRYGVVSSWKLEVVLASGTARQVDCRTEEHRRLWASADRAGAV